jgi:two-component system catabolic regulation response regulator CreB
MKPRILIVDDEQAIVDTIQYALETEGFDTLCLSSGAPVLSALETQRVDLVVLDIGLPDVSGLELCKDIRNTRPVPVIFLTARTDEVDRVVGLEIGADDYVVKPFSPRELTARVKAVLRRTRTREPDAESGPFRVDEERHRISYFGTPLALSRYEYRLLGTLVRRPGRVFTRDQLMGRVWDEPEVQHGPHGGRAHQEPPGQDCGAVQPGPGSHRHAPRDRLRAARGPLKPYAPGRPDLSCASS